jgi:hypothetical protein
MTKNKTLKKTLVLITSGMLLAIVIVACSGGVSHPTDTVTPAKPGSPPTSAPATTYPEPGENLPSPISPYPYPPAGEFTNPYPGSLEPYPMPIQPYPGPLQPYPAPWQPQASDQNLQRGEVFIEEMDVLPLKNIPTRYTLTLQGNLPTPCHQLRVEVNPPDGQNVIQVSAYSVVDPNAICTQVLSPFQAYVPIQDQPAGKYTVVVNGKEAGSIEMP